MGDIALFTMIMILAILFAGDPDIADGIYSYLASDSCEQFYYDNPKLNKKPDQAN